MMKQRSGGARRKIEEAKKKKGNASHLQIHRRKKIKVVGGNKRHHMCAPQAAPLRIPSFVPMENSETLRPQAYAVGAWPVDAGGRAFRHLRIRQHGTNAYGNNHLMCCGFEVYGALLDSKPHWFPRQNRGKKWRPLIVKYDAHAAAPAPVL